MAISHTPSQAGVGAASAPNVDPHEVEKFARLAAEWWRPDGPFRPLHRLNPARLGFIRERVCAHFSRDPSARQPFAGLKALDLGCGGGLVSEPIARMGAAVTAIDAAPDTIAAARAHAAALGLEIDYRHGLGEDLQKETGDRFDFVVSLEVIEHVPNPAEFLCLAAGFVKPGGLLILSTINRTQKARALAIFAAERILRWTPIGSHHFEKLVKPEEIERPLREAGLIVQGPFGLIYDPIKDDWRIGPDASVNYMMAAAKPA